MKIQASTILSIALTIFQSAPILFATTEIEQHRLYTPPAPQASGGISGSIAAPQKNARQILAIPRTQQHKAYRAQLGPDGKTFSFRGLPMDHYDLIVFYDDHVYEGIRLSRENNSLTSKDESQISTIIEKSEPFFTIKEIHRLAGQTGRGSDAMGFVTFARDRKAEMYDGPVIRSGMRRTHKLVFLRQVGPGWQIARTRDLYPIWIEQDAKHNLRPRHTYSAKLAGIRVTTQMRTLDSLDLIETNDEE